MTEFDDLIRFENENTSLDFKAVQYSKTSHEALIKDIMAMANADLLGDRHIIVGVKHHPDGRKETISIVEKEFVDSATYHQLLRENVEPEIHFDYLPHRFENALLGVFRIHDCVEQPYMMRKAFGNLKQGDCYIRKGTHQARMMRKDLDRILERREGGFTGIIRMGFDAPDAPKQVTIPAAGNITLPSDLAAKKIRAILAEREQPSRELTWLQQVLESGAVRGSILSPTPYEQRSTAELRQNLEHVKDTYRDADLYELYEVNGKKINLWVVNEGDTYIEDTSVRIQIQKVDGLRIARRIHHKPDRSGPFGHSVVTPNLLYGRGYPTVTNHERYIDVRASVGNLRHGIPTLTFAEPLRMVFERKLIGHKIDLSCTLFGKQLRAPRREMLSVNVIEPAPHKESTEKS